MQQLVQRILLVGALALFVGASAGCEKKSKTVVVEDESGRFEKIGEGIDKTKEAAETTAEEAEKTADTISDDN
jgi:hypothetical protein